MTDFVDANYLFKAYKRVRKHTHWKSSVKEYGINLLQNISDTQSDIRFLRYKPKSLYEFKIHERGRERLIKAQPRHTLLFVIHSGLHFLYSHCLTDDEEFFGSCLTLLSVFLELIKLIHLFI